MTTPRSTVASALTGPGADGPAKKKRRREEDRWRFADGARCATQVAIEAIKGPMLRQSCRRSAIQELLNKELRIASHATHGAYVEPTIAIVHEATMMSL